ncbi:oligosaccharide flippase family protein [Leptolyngbya sp. NIES-2104]|uniref:oligosaccharide flippase family protein n=1 Tax=Leptolyngbya sp. NIES-2104 TaxID=1552121 RepID=UPI0006ECC9CD|nr:oligosaccharide flippase family protein [Leptolyngbya sp. NIES-2104]GAP97891.1 polysaccharide biosynthesis protein [Leptolyngbya sp. NIES-2104]
MTSSLKQLAIRGAFWTIAGYGGRQILRLGSNLIMTRLLRPEFFGLMALVTTIKIGIELFSDYGISQSVVNNKQGDDPVFLDTAWSLKVIRGFQIWVLSFVLAYPFAQFYRGQDPQGELLYLLPLVGFTAVLDGFSSTALLSWERHLEVRKLMIYDLAVTGASLVGFVLLCWWSPTVWALAIGNVLSGGINMVASHFVDSRYRNRFRLDREVLREIQNFGKWVAVASAIMFMADQADRFILAKLLSFEKLGVYTIAYTLASIPRDLIRELSSKVIYPTISKQLDIPRLHLREKIVKQRWLLLIGLAVSLALLTTCGDWVIMLLYQGRNKHWDQYQHATWMMPILCSGIWFSVLFYTTSPALMAISKPVYSAQSNFVRFAMVGIGMPLAFSQFGEVGAIVMVALSDFPLYAVNLYGLKQEKLSCTMQDLYCTAFFVAILVFCLLTRYSLGFGVPIHVLLQHA